MYYNLSAGFMKFETHFSALLMYLFMTRSPLSSIVCPLEVLQWFSSQPYSAWIPWKQFLRRPTCVDCTRKSILPRASILYLTQIPSSHSCGPSWGRVYPWIVNMEGFSTGKILSSSHTFRGSYYCFCKVQFPWFDTTICFHNLTCFTAIVRFPFTCASSAQY